MLVGTLARHRHRSHETVPPPTSSLLVHPVPVRVSGQKMVLLEGFLSPIDYGSLFDSSRLGNLYQ